MSKSSGQPKITVKAVAAQMWSGQPWGAGLRSLIEISIAALDQPCKSRASVCATHPIGLIGPKNEACTFMLAVTAIKERASDRPPSNAALLAAARERHREDENAAGYCRCGSKLPCPDRTLIEALASANPGA